MKIPAGLEKSNTFVKSSVSARSNVSEKSDVSGENVKPGVKIPLAPELKSSGKPPDSIEPAFLNQKNLSTPKPVLNQVPMDPLPEKPAESVPGGKMLTAGELLKESAANMGLPKDFLSAGLLALARFFSLSINPQLIRALRREILASGKSSSPESLSDKAALEAEILARLSAEDKGVVLSSEALEHYCAFFGSPGGEKEEPQEQEEDPAADELKAISEKQAQNDRLLDYMNSIPGKNGQYWVMIPFSIKVRGIELKVFIRLLKKEGEKEAFLIADISGPSRQWRCFLKEANGKLRADIRVYPKYSDLALISLQKEAAAFLNNGSALFGNSTDEVLVKNGDSVFSWIDDLYNESTSRASINEEV